MILLQKKQCRSTNILGTDMCRLIIFYDTLVSWCACWTFACVLVHFSTFQCSVVLRTDDNCLGRFYTFAEIDYFQHYEKMGALLNSFFSFNYESMIKCANVINHAFPLHFLSGILNRLLMVTSQVSNCSLCCRKL